ncbi:MAG: CsbD family protein [Candidatus Dormibacteraeota bacterium]|nr:CsbD family protein [Candidatus Dormibacteraeota bacterium]
MKDKLESKAEELKGKLTGDESEELKGDAKQTGEDLASDAEEDSATPEHSPGHVIPRSAE